MSGTDVHLIHIDLAAAGTSAGDAQKDVIFIEATNGNDVITLSMQNGALVVDGLAAQIVIEHFDLGDEVHVLGLGGDDSIDTTNLGSGGPTVFWDGGAGNDVLLDAGVVVPTADPSPFLV